MTVGDLPHVNAALNAVSTVLIVAGFAMIRRKRVAAHRACMVSAAAVSALFLVTYLVYHYHAGHVRFTHGGAVRVVYLAILISHVVLAATVPFLVGIALYLGLRRRDDRHRRVVRWAFPIWLYVSITGVVIYVMLYHMYAADSIDGGCG